MNTLSCFFTQFLKKNPIGCFRLVSNSLKGKTQPVNKLLPEDCFLLPDACAFTAIAAYFHVRSALKNKLAEILVSL